MKSSKLWPAALLLLEPGSGALAQVRIDPGRGKGYDGYYGAAERVDVEEIARDPTQYDHRAVRVRGILIPDQQPYSIVQGLAAGSGQLLGIPVDELTGEMSSVAGREVELVGLVRRLPQNQSTERCPLPAPESKCADPLLPALPNQRAGWPQASLTFWKLTDLSDPRGSAGGAPGRVSLESLLSEPGAYDGQKVTLVGQFRGHNLFGDLPAKTERGPLDWVLKAAADAVWIVGKSPKGSGFELDPKLPSDAGRWLEVVGKPETVGGVTYVRAQKISLAKAPKGEE